MYICIYTSTIYSVSVLIKTIFSKNRKAGRGPLGPLGLRWAFFVPKGVFYRKKSIKINATFFAANFVPKS